MIGRLASLKTTYQKGTVTNTLMYTATEMVTVNVSAANQTEDKLTHSVSISGKSDITKLSPLVNAGTGYTDGTGLALIGGNGSGATVDITVHGNGTVSGVDIFDGGREYKSGDSVSITNTNASGIKQVSIGSSGNAYPAGITQFVFSDVLDDSLETIASGVAAPDTYEFSEDQKILTKTKLNN